MNHEVYFNPVDEDWKRETCGRLGFTYKRKKLVNMVPDMNPLNRCDQVHNLVKVLSEFICGDRNLHIKLKKKLSYVSKLHYKKKNRLNINLFDYMIKLELKNE